MIYFGLKYEHFVPKAAKNNESWFFFLWNGALFPKCYPLLLQESHSFSSFFLPELPMTLEMCGTVAWLAQHTECIDRLANIQLQSALQVIAKQKV